MHFDKVGFIGLGLIGGSIARKMKENNPKVSIIATAGHQKTVDDAFGLGLIDNNELLELNSFKDCDVIFLCAPVNKNIEYLTQLKDIIKDDCIITDVGSTKTQIHEKVIELGLERNFIGGHPMTGSEKTGILNSDKQLLENAYYIITPTTATTEENLNNFRQFVLSLGSIALILDYREHDHATAAISHLPHMIAYSLVNLIEHIDSEKETMKTIAAGGFRDVTRIAASSPVMWENICESNKTQLLSLMDQYEANFHKLREIIAEGSSQKMLDYFQDSKNYRDSLTLPGAKIRKDFHEIFVDIADEAGGIAVLASLLAFNGISIKNIGIMNNREFEEGVLRIEFYDEDALESAIKKETILFTADDLSCYMALIQKQRAVKRSNFVLRLFLYHPVQQPLPLSCTNNTVLIYAFLKNLVKILKGLAAAIRVNYLNPLCHKPRQCK